jgi:hypothetical protein
MSISISQCIDICRQAGFPEHSIPIAVAVAICESGLDPENRCLNCFPGILEDSRGLWQINVRVHPEFDIPTIFDPLVNAGAAFTISSSGTDWTPWTTFRNDCYKQHLAAVTDAMRTSVTVNVNGTEILNAKAFLLNGSSFGWVRPIATALGAQIVDFNSSSVSLMLADVEQKLAATITSGQAFVHLADFRKFNGVTVAYDEGASAVHIDSTTENMLRSQRSDTHAVFARTDGDTAAMRFQWEALSGGTLAGSTVNYNISYDANLGEGGFAVAQGVLNTCERDFTTVQGLFGGITPPGLPFNILISSGVGGAGHFGCGGVDIECDSITTPAPDPAFSSFLIVAEIVEVFSDAQGAGWDCSASNGEGLSRVLATYLYPDKLTALPGFTTAASWLDGARTDYVNQTLPADRDPQANGCAVLFLNYLRYQLGYSWNAIVAAGGATLQQTYSTLTGDAGDPFPAFMNLLQSQYPAGVASNLATDNPFPLQAAPSGWNPATSPGSASHAFDVRSILAHTDAITREVDALRRVFAPTPGATTPPRPLTALGLNDLNLQIDLIPAGNSNRPGTPISPTYITIHNTGNSDRGADALMHAQYLKSAEARVRQVSWHYTVDDHRVIQSLTDHEMGWHAGTRHGNQVSLGIEICQNAGIDQIAAIDRACRLTAVLMHSLKIGPVKIVPHHFWTGKDCPEVILHDRSGWTGAMTAFVARTNEYLSKIQAIHIGDDRGDTSDCIG